MVTRVAHPLELTPEKLRQTVDPDSLGFTSTASLPAPGTIAGQERALESIAFALAIKEPGYNLYVSGLPGTGRSTSVEGAAARAARGVPAEQDWCYVYHFERPGEPLALALPAGSAPSFARAVEALVANCRRELRSTFAGEAYRTQREAALKTLKEQRQQVVEGLQREALGRGFLVQFTPSGVAALPLKRKSPPSSAQTETATPDIAVPPAMPSASENGTVEPMTPIEFESLPDEERQRISEANDALQEPIARALSYLAELGEEAHTRLHELNDAIARRVVAPQAETLLGLYRDQERVADFLRHLLADIVARSELLIRTFHEAASEPGDDEANAGGEEDSDIDENDQAIANEWAIPDGVDDGLSGRELPAVAALLRRYRVNVMITRQQPDSAPVVREINPSYSNLVGRIEFGLRNGLPVTDHLMLKPGAFHRASGGYLIVHARDIFTQPNAWHAIKRTLRFGVISLEESNDTIALPASASIRPEPIPVNLKVILIGDPETYAMLQALDPEFSELFKIRADFDSSMPRTASAQQFYAQFIGDAVRCAALPPLGADAVALCIEEGSRWVADQGRLSTILSDVRDLALESASIAIAAKEAMETSASTGASTGTTNTKPEHLVTTRAHVFQALAARERRLNLAADRIDEMIREGTILIDTQGEAVGQINGLTVLLSGNYAFGKPARITARTAPGMTGIVNIERETMMSGPAHSKGILVLGGYLAGRFAHDQPLSLSASICLEQVYGEIEGDSASSAELYALLSSLAGLPLKQSLAVTGSVNQHGVVQAIGGVNEKIEGFFTLCAHGGLTGDQGVIIPGANVRNLMLQQEVIDAVRAGTFHIYAVGTIDEGIEILTGVAVGVADADGIFPAGSVNARVSQTLHGFARSMHAFGPTAGPTLWRAARHDGDGIYPGE
jgi:predicted ATP-dependent protease